ncbi:MAG: cytochrome c biogenesis protein CcsA [Polyangiales bacterium]
MRWMPAISGLAFALMAAALWTALDWAPVAQDAAGGLTQKIFYFHVPSAYVMYIGVGACVLGSIGYLAQRTPGWDALAQAGAEMAVVFSSVVLITGPLWARKAWGAYWAWDPRLTTTLLGTLIFVAYLVLHTNAAGEAERKFSAALAVMGACVMPVIHYSVQLWRGQHPTVITSRGGGLAPEMGKTLALSFTAFTVMAAALLFLRARVALGEARLAELRTEAVSLGLLDEEAV